MGTLNLSFHVDVDSQFSHDYLVTPEIGQSCRKEYFLGRILDNKKCGWKLDIWNTANSSVKIIITV